MKKKLIAEINKEIKAWKRLIKIHDEILTPQYDKGIVEGLKIALQIIEDSK